MSGKVGANHDAPVTGGAGVARLVPPRRPQLPATAPPRKVEREEPVIAPGSVAFVVNRLVARGIKDLSDDDLKQLLDFVEHALADPGSKEFCAFKQSLPRDCSVHFVKGLALALAEVLRNKETELKARGLGLANRIQKAAKANDTLARIAPQVSKVPVLRTRPLAMLANGGGAVVSAGSLATGAAVPASPTVPHVASGNTVGTLGKLLSEGDLTRLSDREQRALIVFLGSPGLGDRMAALRLADLPRLQALASTFGSDSDAGVRSAGQTIQALKPQDWKTPLSTILDFEDKGRNIRPLRDMPVPALSEPLIRVELTQPASVPTGLAADIAAAVHEEFSLERAKHPVDPRMARAIAALTGDEHFSSAELARKDELEAALKAIPPADAGETAARERVVFHLTQVGGVSGWTSNLDNIARDTGFDLPKFGPIRKQMALGLMQGLVDGLNSVRALREQIKGMKAEELRALVDRFSAVSLGTLGLAERLAEAERRIARAMAAVEAGDLQRATLDAQRAVFTLESASGALGRYGEFHQRAIANIKQGLEIMYFAGSVALLAFGGPLASTIITVIDMGGDVSEVVQDARDGKPVKDVAIKLGSVVLSALLRKFGAKVLPKQLVGFVANPVFLQALPGVLVRLAQGKLDYATAAAELVVAAVGGRFEDKLAGWIGRAFPTLPSHVIAGAIRGGLASALIASPKALYAAFESDDFIKALWSQALPDIMVEVAAGLVRGGATGLWRERQAVGAWGTPQAGKTGTGGSSDANKDHPLDQIRRNLGLKPGDPLDLQTAKKAYRKIAGEFHPDKWENSTADDKAAAAKRFMTAAAAYKAADDAHQRGEIASSPAANAGPAPAQRAPAGQAPAAGEGQPATLALPPHQDQPVAATHDAPKPDPVTVITSPDGRQALSRPAPALDLPQVAVPQRGWIGPRNRNTGRGQPGQNEHAFALAAGAGGRTPEQPQQPNIHLVQNGAGGPQQPAGTPHEPARAMATGGGGGSQSSGGPNQPPQPGVTPPPGGGGPAGPLPATGQPTVANPARTVEPTPGLNEVELRQQSRQAETAGDHARSQRLLAQADKTHAKIMADQAFAQKNSIRDESGKLIPPAQLQDHRKAADQDYQRWMMQVTRADAKALRWREVETLETALNVQTAHLRSLPAGPEHEVFNALVKETAAKIDLARARAEDKPQNEIERLQEAVERAKKNPVLSPAQAALAAMEAEVDAETAKKLGELEARPMNPSLPPEIRLAQKDADSARILFNSADTKAKKLAVLAKTHPSLSAKATIAAGRAKRDYQTYQVKNSSLAELAAEATYRQLQQEENALWDKVEAQIGSKLIRGFGVPKAVAFYHAEWAYIRDYELKSLRGASNATATARVRLELATRARIEAAAQTGQKSDNLSFPPLHPDPRQAFVTAEKQEERAESSFGAAIKNYQQAEKLYRERLNDYSAVEYLEEGDEHPEVAMLAKERLLQAGEDCERARARMEKGWETLKTATRRTFAREYDVMRSKALSGLTWLR